jgi:hypothetical protein
MSWVEQAEDFTALVERDVRKQFPEVALSEPHPGYFLWRYGSNIVQMLVAPDDGSVRLSFVPEADTATPQRFPYTAASAPEIAKSIIEWLNFRRYNRRGL